MSDGGCVDRGTAATVLPPSSDSGMRTVEGVAEYAT